MKNENLERQILGLVALDRVDIPISSFSAKIKRRKEKFGGSFHMPGEKTYFEGERVYARVEDEDLMKARGMKEGIAEFGRQFPRYGKILTGLIEQQRASEETHLYFGVRSGRKLTSDDYVGVLTSLGLSENRARELYPVLVDISQNLSRKRDEERRLILG